MLFGMPFSVNLNFNKQLMVKENFKMKGKKLTIFIIVLLAIQSIFEVACIFGPILAVLAAAIAPCSIVVPGLRALLIILSYDAPKYMVLLLILAVLVPCLEIAASISVLLRKRLFPILLLILHIASVAFCIAFICYALISRNEASEDVSTLIYINLYKSVCSAVTAILLIIYSKRAKR